MPFLRLIIGGEDIPVEIAPQDRSHLCRSPLPGTWDWPMFDVGTVWQCPECKKIHVWGRSSFHHNKKERFNNCFWTDVIDGIT